MAAYRPVYDSRHLLAESQDPGSAPEHCRAELLVPVVGAGWRCGVVVSDVRRRTKLPYVGPGYAK